MNGSHSRRRPLLLPALTSVALALFAVPGIPDTEENRTSIIGTRPSFRKGIRLEYLHVRRTRTRSGPVELAKEFRCDLALKTLEPDERPTTRVRLSFEEIGASIRDSREALKYDSRHPERSGQDPRLGLLVETLKGSSRIVDFTSEGRVTRVGELPETLKGAPGSFLEQLASPAELRRLLPRIYSLAPGEEEVDLAKPWTLEESIEIDSTTRVRLRWTHRLKSREKGRVTLELRGQAEIREAPTAPQSTRVAPVIRRQELTGELIWDETYGALRRLTTRIRLEIEIVTPGSGTPRTVQLEQDLDTRLRGVP